MITTVESGRRYLPKGITPPTSPREAILAARTLLEEEDRWAQGTWFKNDAFLPEHDMHTEYLSDPFCGSWRACVMGALGVVTLGVTKQTYEPHEPAGRVNTVWRMRVLGDLGREAELYRQAEATLSGLAKQKGFLDAIHMNDSDRTKRDDILALMQEAADSLT